MPRQSRPPGFEMTYKPYKRQSFGAAYSAWVFPVLYLFGSIAFVTIVVVAHTRVSDNWLLRFVVEGDSQRPLSAFVLSLITLGGAIAALIRTAMIGVIIHPDGVEVRDVVSFGWPKVKNCSWPEIDEIELGGRLIGLRMWDGNSILMPSVRNPTALRHALERVGVARGIPLRGDSVRDVQMVQEEIEDEA